MDYHSNNSRNIYYLFLLRNLPRVDVLWKITAVVVLAFILFLGAATIFGNKKDVSITENRELAKAPKISAGKLYNGDTSKELGEYMTDHFAGRSIWLSAKTTLVNKFMLEMTDFLMLTHHTFKFHKFILFLSVPLKTYFLRILIGKEHSLILLLLFDY